MDLRTQVTLERRFNEWCEKREYPVTPFNLLAFLCENDMIDDEGVECFLTTTIKAIGNRYGAGVAFPSNYCVFCEHVDAVIYDTRGGAYFRCKHGHVYDEHNLTCKYFDLKGENDDESGTKHPSNN